MEKLGVYEYVAVIVPGVAFLFGLGTAFPQSEFVEMVLLPRDFGTATVHLVLAFAIGHLLQVVGQLTHHFYWADFGGLPTDWPFTREHRELAPELQSLVLAATGIPRAVDLFEWRHAVATARSMVTAAGQAGRLESFHANYGMFRSMVVACVALLLLNPWGATGASIRGGVITLVMGVSGLGMHRFAVHYARELFAALRAHSREPRTVNFTRAGFPSGLGEPSAAIEQRLSAPPIASAPATSDPPREWSGAGIRRAA